MKMLSVRPCPECGESMRLAILRKYDPWMRYAIECLICGYKGKRAFTMIGAVNKWNNDKERAK